MTQVIFDPSSFRARYKEFSSVSDMTLKYFFDEACMYLSNSDKSPVQDLVRRKMLLGMLTAHVAFLGGALSEDGQAKPVGRLSSGTEGSVSASFDYVAAVPGSGAWFMQTQYGAAFWQSTVSLRCFRYVQMQTAY